MATTKPLTEDQIEIRVEYKADKLDARFMNGEISQEEYDAANYAITQWAEAQYALLTN